MQDTLTKQKSATTEQENTTSNVSAEVDKVIVVSIAAFAGLVGIWSVACMVGAMVQSGGPFELIKGWFRAVSGM